MPIDFDALRGEVELPDDGDHVAWLDRCAIVTTGAGEERLVSEWKDAQRHEVQWTSWNGFAGQGMGFTRDFLLGLGIDLATVNDTTALEDALHACVGHVYNTRVSGRDVNGRVFINTYVTGRANNVQEALDVKATALDELGTDRSGLPGTVTAPPPPQDKPWEDDKPPF